MSHPASESVYVKVWIWLGILTVAEICVALPDVGVPRMPLILGLGVMAVIKAALVGMFYMHLRYEGSLIYVIIAVPLLLVLVMVAGFLPDAIGW
ncbi:MAG: cytochrome C oxidase subunit IV family protein [Planctomycetota bacterium]